MSDKDYGRGVCADCGAFPAFMPRVHVLHLEEGTSKHYHLRLPHLCDSCCHKRGLTRHGLLVPKLREFQTPLEMLAEHLEKVPAWTRMARDKGIRDLMAEGMSEEDAKSLIGGD